MRQIEREVAQRAKELVLKTGNMKSGNHTARKRETLKRIAASKPTKPRNA